jgi:hypothetical protein
MFWEQKLHEVSPKIKLSLMRHEIFATLHLQSEDTQGNEKPVGQERKYHVASENKPSR